MRRFVLAAALVLAPFAGHALAQDARVRVPGHWETRRDFAESPGHWETRARSVWHPAGYVTETRTRIVPGHWEIDFAGARFWFGERTVSENVSVYRAGFWETVNENVWVPGVRSEREHRVWIAEHFESAPAPSGPVNPWDDTPRTQPVNDPLVTVEPINGVNALAPSSERLREPFLPTAPRLAPAPDPFARRVVVTTPAPRECKPLVLVEAEPEPCPTTVIYRPAPRPTVVYREPCAPAVVYVGDPCPPSVVVYGRDPWCDRWRPAPCAPPCAQRPGVRVGVGVGVRVGGGVHVGIGVGVRVGGGHHR